MAKKKNQSKKHKFKYADPSASTMSAMPVSNGEQNSQNGVVSRSPRAGGAAAVPTRDFSYVAGDLRRILVLAVILVALEFGLWFLFAHTGVGSQVYSLVKV